MWERVVRDVLPTMRRLVPAGSRVLEIGYGDGLLTCYLCCELGWSVRGLDIVPEARIKATENACRLGVGHAVRFTCCKPEETWQHEDEYDAVFIKTVLYNAPNLKEYGRWLDRILSVLKPGGVLINFETGRANRFVQIYRKLRRREYSDYLLYNSEIEPLYDAGLHIIERRYYGGWSQFLTPISWLYKVAYRVEESIAPRHADNCFAVSIIARKNGS